MRKEVWMGVHKDILVTKGDFPMKGIKFKVYPKEEGIIHAFQAPYIIQEHGEEKNSKDELLLVDTKKISSLTCVNSRQSDYNRHTNASFMYQSASLEYHELIED